MLGLYRTQSSNKITWISTSDDSVGYKKKFIESIVRQVSRMLVSAIIIQQTIQQFQEYITRDKKSGRPTLVAYCTDENFDKKGVVSAFAAKVSLQ